MAHERPAPLQAVVLDVDGVLTDGALTFRGREPTARFHARDGTAMLGLVRAGYRVAILSGRDGTRLRERFTRLGLDEILLGVRDKGQAFDDLLARWGLPASAVVFVGDDLIDRIPMARAGLAVAPADAHPEIRAMAHAVAPVPGGRGVLSWLAHHLRARTPRGAGEVDVGALTLGPRRPMAWIAGLNTLDAPDPTLRVAEALASIADRLGVGLIFKGSYDKANRSRLDAPRGPGLYPGLSTLRRVRETLGVPVVTDVHTVDEVGPVAGVVDLVQIPAFLVRQTDLVVAAAQSGRPLHLKKMTSMGPDEMGAVVDKARDAGATGVIACERGTSFGYGRLVVDPTALPALASRGVPVSFDLTHALQRPGQAQGATAGSLDGAAPLARAMVATGLAALFVETHPDPSRAPCDGGSAIPLGQVEAFMAPLVDLDRFVKGR